MVLNLKQSSKDLSRINEGENTDFILKFLGYTCRYDFIWCSVEKYTKKIVLDNSQPCLAYIFSFSNQGFIAQTTSWK